MIRWASVADAEGMARVHVESWEAAYRGLIPDEVIDRLSVERRTAGWNQMLRDPERRTAVFVAEHSGELVGLCAVGPTRDDDLDAERVGEVRAIYVLPDYWGHGHGKDLMMESLDWLRSGGFAAAMLWVLDTNTIGREFYEQGGWRLDDAVKVDESFGAPLNEVRYRIGVLRKS
jgi:GNAT superfamily N-acetyltransferase